MNDLFSLIHFIELSPWNDAFWWEKYIKKVFEKDDDLVYNILKIILKPILLRRTKIKQKMNQVT